MKIIEAMKQIKINEEKIVDLRQKISTNCANLSYETLPYGDNKTTAAKVKSWCQSCVDLSQECVRLLVAIQRTNLATEVTIELGGKPVTKTIAEWIWRRRKYADMDKSVYASLTNRGLKQGLMEQSTGEPVRVEVVYQFDHGVRDQLLDIYHTEPKTIDGKLEVVNAITDLIEA